MRNEIKKLILIYICMYVGHPPCRIEGKFDWSTQLSSQGNPVEGGNSSIEVTAVRYQWWPNISHTMDNILVNNNAEYHSPDYTSRPPPVRYPALSWSQDKAGNNKTLSPNTGLTPAKATVSATLWNDLSLCQNIMFFFKSVNELFTETYRRH